MSARAARNFAPEAPDRQLSLPALDLRPEPPPLPEPAPARACAGCGWYVGEAEETCPMCHARKDSPP